MANLLEELGNLLQEEANVKINRAMTLFIRSPEDLKNLALHMTGFKGELTAVNLREHFDTLELLDQIDDLIDNLESNLELEGIDTK